MKDLARRGALALALFLALCGSARAQDASAPDAGGSVAVDPGMDPGAVQGPDATDIGVPADPTNPGFPSLDPGAGSDPSAGSDPGAFTGDPGTLTGDPGAFTGDPTGPCAPTGGTDPSLPTVQATGPMIDPATGLPVTDPTGVGYLPDDGGDGPVATATAAEPSSYTVQSGDTLAAIAANLGVSVNDLLAANPQITDPNMIFVGQSLTLPGGASTPAPVAGAPAPSDPQGGAIPGTETAIQNAIADPANLNPDDPSTGHVQGDGNWNFYCLGLVNTAFGHSIPALGAPSAQAAFNTLQAQGVVQSASQSSPPPRGAIVFFSYGSYGHVGISNGDGTYVSSVAYGNSVDPARPISWGTFLGWVNPNQAR